MTIYNQVSVYPTVPIGYLGKGDGTTWPFIEQQQGVFNWTALDEYVQVAQDHGLSFYWTNANIPPWAAADQNSCSYYQGTKIKACTSMVSNIQYVDDFINALVERYQGKIQMYELWNEPDVPQCFHWHHSANGGDYAACVRRRSRRRSQRADRGSVVEWCELAAVHFEQGGPEGVDMIDLHGYPNVGLNDVPEAIVAFRNVNWRINMAAIGLQGKPIWDSENSWGGPDANEDPDFRASFVARSLLEHWSVGMPEAFLVRLGRACVGHSLDTERGYHACRYCLWGR